MMAVAMAMVLAVIGAGCSTETATEADSTAVGGIGSGAGLSEADATASTADPAAGQTTEGTDTASTDSPVTTAAAQSDMETGEIGCEPYPYGYQVILTNTNDRAADYAGNLSITLEDGTSGLEPVLIQSVQPGETLREPAGVIHLDRPDVTSPVASCSNVDVAAAPSLYVGDQSAFNDVTSCDIHEGDLGEPAISIDGTNSGRIGAYSTSVGVYNADGERVMLQLVNVPEYLDLTIEPGAAIQGEVTIYSSMVPYDPSLTCRIVAVEKFTPFFDDSTGTLVGSLSSDVAFETGSAILTADAIGILRDPITEITTHYSGAICIEGYADSVGDDASNLALSQQRAQAVADYLAYEGITNDIEVRGYGEAEATADEQDDPALRRVDVTLAACSA